MPSCIIDPTFHIFLIPGGLSAFRKRKKYNAQKVSAQQVCLRVKYVYSENDDNDDNADNIKNEAKTFIFYGDKGHYPISLPNFAPGNETQTVADARGDQVYGQ